ncbi:hypothetical protein CK510_02020 [Brunnivagina elsteri CCALA 953]|uniref:Uncharacterized protein n=2 Tax=Brunnivagina TaxID=3344733 RepID=A0A2A2TPI2_9CYAN|nr:hypothetical protein CK510_02020 [Calothrix elsteri CCALA 953]
MNALPKTYLKPKYNLHQTNSSHTNSKTKILNIEECKSVNFGQVALDEQQSAILALMNRQIILLCRSLPASLQDSAVIVIQRYYTGFKISNLLTFFTKFYAPSWSLIHWMQQAKPVLQASELENAFSAQAMAYFVHMLDDRLANGQIPTSHLLLHLRSSAWVKFHYAAIDLTKNIVNSEELVEELIDNYFSGIHEPAEVDSINSYCNLFCKQFSTTLVIPILVAKNTGFDTALVRQAYESFGIAWRLLDDLRSCRDDAFAGELSAIYYLLPVEERQLWLDCQGEDEESNYWQKLQSYLEQQGILRKLISHICTSLKEAQKNADLAGLDGYANQFQQLAMPLREM